MSSTDVETPIEPYTWSMPEDAKVVALEELREDDAIREQSLEQFREWIQKHPNIKKCRTDAPFLLRFLRTKKFSLPQACNMLERYLSVRELYPQWFKNLDCNDPVIDEIVSTGYILPLPGRDQQNRKIMMTFAGKFDPYKYTAEQMSRTHALITEAFLDDELNQVYGYTYINDESGLVMGHLSLWPLMDLRTMIGCIQTSTPMRHKETHFINVPMIATKVVDFVRSLLSEKLRNRLMVHKSLDDLKDKFDSSILPKELGGEIPMSVLIEDLKKRLQETRESILALDDMAINVDSNFKLDSDMKEELGTGIAGSFRKLQVD